MPKLSPAHRRQLLNAMLEAFPDQDALGSFAFEFLDADLAAFGGKYALPKVIIQNMIIKAESRDGVNRLVAAARASEPEAAALSKLSFELLPAAAPGGDFEVLINKANNFIDPKVFLPLLAQLDGQVGRVEYGDAPAVAMGTAFLVGPDMVMTNFHVLDAIRKRGVALDKVHVRFDYAVMPDGVQQSAGRRVALAPDPVMDESGTSPHDLNAAPPADPDLDHLDYALLRLHEPIGAQPRDTEGQSGTRGWVRRPIATPAIGEPLWIIQHPLGDPVKLAFAEAAVTGVNANRTRFRHKVNTRPGSSGSPCFNQNLDLVGIHHYGDDRSSLPYNQAIPMSTIVDRAKANGHELFPN